jgi:uncharacterized protein (TIGR02145 family)
MALFLIFTSSCKKDNDNSTLYDPTNSEETNGKTTAVFNTGVTYGTLTDQDGNVYKTVTIGTQIWMAENLRTTKYNDGTAIPNVIYKDEWSNLRTGAYVNYENSISAEFIATCGRLYNWYAVNTGKLAPKGWHVPTDAEWTTLINFLGGKYAAGKLKETGTTHWKTFNTGATNETGFTALPGGYYGFYDILHSGYWWSATEQNATSAWSYYMYNNTTILETYNYSKGAGFSVRCVRD